MRRCALCVYDANSRDWERIKSRSTLILLRRSKAIAFFSSIFLVSNWLVRCYLLLFGSHPTRKISLTLRSTAMQSFPSPFFQKAVQEILMNINLCDAMAFFGIALHCFLIPLVWRLENIELHSFSALISRQNSFVVVGVSVRSSIMVLPLRTPFRISTFRWPQLP